jgi:hypothetical protein
VRTRGSTTTLLSSPGGFSANGGTDVDDQRRDLRECDGCGRTIRFCQTTKGSVMPVDPNPNPDGNVRLRHAAGGGWLAEVMTKADLAVFQGPRYTPHFATCSAAAEYRRPRRRRGTPPGRNTR